MAGNLWYVAKGVERLVQWTEGRKPVWNCIECTRIHNASKKATPHEVRCEVWMSIIHGSTGLVYFVHEWEPKFNESALLSDPEMLSAVTAVNRRITELAPVLNSPTIAGGAKASSDNSTVPVASMVKKHAGATYVFAVAMRGEATTATSTLQGLGNARIVEVLGENRAVTLRDGVFTDDFGPWDVHLYRIQ